MERELLVLALTQNRYVTLSESLLLWASVFPI